jgi:hypothetical protein
MAQREICDMLTSRQNTIFGLAISSQQKLPSNVVRKRHRIPMNGQGGSGWKGGGGGSSWQGCGGGGNWKPLPSDDKEKAKSGCFRCGQAHSVRNCPYDVEQVAHALNMRNKTKKPKSISKPSQKANFIQRSKHRRTLQAFATASILSSEDESDGDSESADEEENLEVEIALSCFKLRQELLSRSVSEPKIAKAISRFEKSMRRL